MSKQEQSVTEGSTAYQSARDLHVSGLSAEEVKDLMREERADSRALIREEREYAISEFRKERERWEIDARKMFDERAEEIRARIDEAFIDREDANKEAFKDPDFQYQLKVAEHAYARSGDEGLRDTLVSLIVSRSQQCSRGRLSLALNQAIDKANLLTKNEFAELSLVYIITRVIRNDIKTFGQMKNFIIDYILRFVPDVSSSEASYSYLLYLGCATLNMVPHRLDVILQGNYGGFISKGIDIEQIRNHLPDDKKNVLDNSMFVIPCMHNPDKLQLNATSKDVFLGFFESGVPITKEEASNIWNLFVSSMYSIEELPDLFGLPELKELFRLWDTTMISRINLTSTGVAIGYANLTGNVPLNADLSIWIN